MNDSPIHLVMRGDDLEAAYMSLVRVIKGDPYYSDCSEDEDICFTIYTSSRQAIEEWMVASVEAGMVQSAEILDW